MERLGVFLCTGCEIGESLDTDGFEGLVKEEGAAQFTAHPCLCNPDGVAAVKAAADGGEVDGLVIAACSARHKQAEFRFDPTKVAVERVSLREQVVKTHPAGDEDTQMLAEDMLRMGVARASKMKLAVLLDEPIEETVLVVGGGLAGLQAAVAAAGMGHPVALVEKADTLGGYLANLKEIIPTEPPYDRLHANPVPALIGALEADELVTIYLGAKTAEISGQPGQFTVRIESSGKQEEIKVGAIVQATGSKPYDLAKIEKYGVGLPNVITAPELDAQIAAGALKLPSGDRPPKQIVFVQCAGSRDAEHLPYCSGECCAATLRQVLAVKAALPETQCTVVYRDLRTPGQLEHFYLAVQDQARPVLAQGDLESVTQNGNALAVRMHDVMLGEDVEFEADLVVLAAGVVPVSADGEALRQLKDAKGRVKANESETQRKAAEALVEKLSTHEGTEILNLTYRQGPDMPSLEYGFPDSHFICFPYETRRTGIYAAGTMRAPMDPGQAAEDGWGAAMKAVQFISAATRGEAVHPRAGDVGVADFFMQRCTSCKRCTEECPFGSLDEDEKGTPQYNELRCRRCGICLGACPERIISFPDFAVDANIKAIKSIEVPDEFDEKPRILALLCENDALPALDDAANNGASWNPWIRIIPVRCLGSVNLAWISEAVSRGIDGIVLIGCKRGDDYQCHYIQGSELAHTRLGNISETLDRLSLESERISVHELGRDEFHRIPAIFDAFAELIDDLGPNPMKGF
ncbi:MAG: hydrogenase iron-sulfur subunit [Pseudomonadota bacterium]